MMELNIGDVFGNWIVFDYTNKIGKNYEKYIKCKCECNYCLINGSIIKDVLIKNLIKGKSKSCGRASKSLNGVNNKKQNKYDLSGEFGIGYTSRGDEFYFDLEDYDKIKDYCWHRHQDGYMRTCVHGTNKKNTYIMMHNLIMDWVCSTTKLNIDHENGKPNDNQKSNLRLCTHSQNMKNVKINSRNTSGYKGVEKSPNGKKWRASLTCNKKFIYLGTFETKEEAIQSRKEAEEKYFGEFNRRRE